MFIALPPRAIAIVISTDGPLPRTILEAILPTFHLLSFHSRLLRRALRASLKPAYKQNQAYNQIVSSFVGSDAGECYCTEEKASSTYGSPRPQGGRDEHPCDSGPDGDEKRHQVSRALLRRERHLRSMVHSVASVGSPWYLRPSGVSRCFG